jgi:LPS export ABC transporter protein LptC
LASFSKVNIVLFRAVLTCAVVALLIVGCKHPVKPKVTPQPTKEKAQSPDIEGSFSKAKIIWDDGRGHKLWEAEFASADAAHADGTSKVSLKDVKATLYKNGKAASRLVAPTATADSRTKEVHASGGVSVTGNGATARCDELVWQSANNRIKGTGHVKMAQENLKIHANSFTADTSLKNAKFTEAKASLE